MKERILAEIRRTAATNGGKALGWRVFERNTGIRYADWYGKYWRGWGDAVREAGLAANTMVARLDDADVLRRYVELAAELGLRPVEGDLRMKRRADPTFPSDKVFRRFGSKERRAELARDFCMATPALQHLADYFPPHKATKSVASNKANDVEVAGYVYLMRSGRFHKIGKSNAVGRREYELAIQMPEKVETIHKIATDDPDGIEAYWHRRFADRHERGEWFRLSASDIAAFKRRKFQ